MKYAFMKQPPDRDVPGSKALHIQCQQMLYIPVSGRAAELSRALAAGRLGKHTPKAGKARRAYQMPAEWSVKAALRKHATSVNMGDFPRWRGRTHLKRDKRESPPEKQTSGTILLQLKTFNQPAPTMTYFPPATSRWC